MDRHARVSTLEPELGENEKLSKQKKEEETSPTNYATVKNRARGDPHFYYSLSSAPALLKVAGFTWRVARVPGADELIV